MKRLTSGNKEAYLETPFYSGIYTLLTPLSLKVSSLSLLSETLVPLVPGPVFHTYIIFSKQTVVETGLSVMVKSSTENYIIHSSKLLLRQLQYEDTNYAVY